ncbi:MAG: ABC transporter permease [Bradymonadales bacterium]|nr:ABC transporter permease [Bradymonadales bacterium]
MLRGPKLSTMARRNLWRHKRRTFLTLLAIAFGILLAVIFTALQDYSFSQMIDTAARMGTGHVTLQHPDYLDTPKLALTLQGGEALREIAIEDRDVLRAVERISGEILIATARDSYGGYFLAYDPTQEDTETLAFLEGIVEGQPFASASDSGVILGRILARNLGLELGDRVVYRLADRNGEIVGNLGRLTGILDTGAPTTDGGLCLLPIDTVRRVLGYQADESTQIALVLSDSRKSAAVSNRLERQVPSQVAVLTWDEVRPELSGFIAMKVGGARFMEMVIMLLVAAGIFNTLFVSVMERSREFGIMMAIGHSPGQIFALVMWESLWLALMGLVAGAVLTAYPYFALSKEGIDMSMMIGKGTEISGIGFDPQLSVGIFPENLFWIGTAVIVATLLSGLYPAWRAARVQPVETIKLV